MKKFFVYTLLLGLIFTQTSCEDNSLKAELEEIRDHLRSAGYLDDSYQTSDGLYIRIYEEGTFGPEKPGPTATCNLHYQGRLMESSAVFDDSFGSTVQFKLGIGQLIQGMDLGLQEFKKGDRGEIYIPSSLGYGTISDRPAGNGVTIEAGSILVFDVNMVSFF